MIDLIVIRGQGDVDGGEISDPLLCSVEPALARGRQEIEKRARARRVRLRTVYRAGVLKGQIAEVHDSLQGVVWAGPIMGVSHVVEGVETYTVLDIERPL